MQGVDLKNLEFIQYHPTTFESAQKRMLVSEATRGEGGRLYYEEGKDKKRVYFMEEKFGKRGNLMPRDVVSRTMAETKKEIFLDATILGKDKIMKKIPEVYELCKKFAGIDITKQSIPVAPSVHFFMGGIAVKNNHETNIKNLYAIGECASIYHGANRLGGNSLLSAIYSGKTASNAILAAVPSALATDGMERPNFSSELENEKKKLEGLKSSQSLFPVTYIKDMLAETMQGCLGIVRNEEELQKGIDDISYYLSIADKIHYDSSELVYFTYSLSGILNLAKAILICAQSRKESRGAHYRSDYPSSSEDFASSTIISYDGGKFSTRIDSDGKYEK